jgi:anti-sigma regulatory factor (Ser/Thr protein kinase)
MISQTSTHFWESSAPRTTRRHPAHALGRSPRSTSSPYSANCGTRSEGGPCRHSTRRSARGVGGRRASEPVEAAIEPGTLVLMYTDGLVDRRDLPLDVGLGRLLAAVLAGTDRPLANLCRELVTVLVPDEATDDVAVLGLKMQHTSDVFTLHIPAEPEELSRVRRGLARWLSDTGVEPNEADELLLACSEACANAIRHAYGPGDGIVEIEARQDDGIVEVTVRDQGQWRRRRAATGGLGLTLIEALADSVRVDGEHIDGTIVTMRRRVGRTVST